MDSYLLVKTLHIISATVLLGTGSGIAFFMWMAHRGGDVKTIAAVAKLVVLADWCFTAPSVVVQFGSGMLLAHWAGFAWSTPWLMVSIILYFVIGACWLPVVVLQIRARDLAMAAVQAGTLLPPLYHRSMRVWFALGCPAFACVIAIVYLMVAKPPLW